ncbi:hypothetical protein CDAR_321631 [Caerostris darwini]|uniref:Uncharacterized protein n=1 Tax=Caerostris darwini TaxID=1538125 RepID=A0AAV4VV09_9ARAC|nr:hypothetical protein CDAR_321631 [Caerostris darwini]
MSGFGVTNCKKVKSSPGKRERDAEVICKSGNPSLSLWSRDFMIEMDLWDPILNPALTDVKSDPGLLNVPRCTCLGTPSRDLS